MKENNCVPVVAITLDRERHLCFPLPAIFQVEDVTGIKVLEDYKEGVKELFENGSLRERLEKLVTLTWAGLQIEDSSLSRDQVARMICPGNMPEVLELVSKAWVGAMNGQLPADQDQAEGEGEAEAEPSPLAEAQPGS